MEKNCEEKELPQPMTKKDKVVILLWILLVNVHNNCILHIHMSYHVLHCHDTCHVMCYIVMTHVISCATLSWHMATQIWLALWQSLPLVAPTPVILRSVLHRPEYSGWQEKLYVMLYAGLRIQSNLLYFNHRQFALLSVVSICSNPLS